MTEEKIRTADKSQPAGKLKKAVRVLWVIYFVFLTIIFLSLTSVAFHDILSLADYCINLVTLVGLYGFVWSKAIGRNQFWKAFFGFFVVWEVFVSFVVPVLMPGLEMYGAKELGVVYDIVGIVLLAPLLYALYKYSSACQNCAPVILKGSWRSLLEWLHFSYRQEELKAQMDGYDSLKFHRTARGMAVICVVAVMLITLGFTLAGGNGMIPALTNPQFWFTVTLYGVATLFVYLEKRWANMALFLIWTIDKISTGVMFPKSIFWQIVGWLIFAPFFYRSYQVETAKARLKAKAPAVAETEPKPEGDSHPKT
ncbi:MAG: hypothetical protein PHT12_02405 [Patescibacteria group bacterium]|nr:hypothetical protein [Patescibacteria group bacterium]